MGNILQSAENDFISGIRVLLVEARQSVVKQVNATMIKTYYEIGRRIVEQEQQGKEVANYGDYILVRLVGVSVRQLWQRLLQAQS